MKNKIKTFLSIIFFILTAFPIWFYRNFPRTKYGVSLMLNLLAINFLVAHYLFIPIVAPALADMISVKPVVVEKVKVVEVETEQKDKVMAEKIISICKQNGLTEDKDIKWVLGKLWNESNWKQYSNHVNNHFDKQGKFIGSTLDRGIAMWNDKHHPEVSDECAYDISCAISEMIKYRKDGKDIWWASDNL